MTELLPIGTRIVFTKTIREPADGDHPAFLLCEEGEAGWIDRHTVSKHYPYSVYADSWPQAAFLVKPDEFRLSENQPC